MIRTGSSLLSWIIVFMTFFSFELAYADVQVQATVDRNQLGPGEDFTLKIAVSSEDSVRIDQPSLPVISGVEILHNWVSSQSKSSVVSSGQGIDFKTVRTKIYSYQFRTTAKGPVSIDPVVVMVDGKSYQTKAITINVTENSIAQQPQQRSQNPSRPTDPFEQFEERFNQMLNRQFGQVPGQSGFMTEPRNNKEAFFILAEVDKTEAYKGEQIVASWYLYTRGRVRDIDTLKYPTLKGFWKEDIQISTHLNFEQDVINGVPYNRALLASYALFPIDEGKQLIDAYKAKATIVGGFGFGRGFKSKKSSEQIPVLVKPLPTEGKPADFAGAVGEFQMTVNVVEKTLVTHQPFTLKVRFDGIGNAKLIELPELPLGDQLEIYDIKNESQFFKNGQSFKEFEVLLIPKNPGPLLIDSLKSSFFDPKKGEYISLISDPIELTVLPGSKQQSIGEERLKSSSEAPQLPEIQAEWNPDYKRSQWPFYLWFIAFGLASLLMLVKFIVDSGVLRRTPTLEETIEKRFQVINKELSGQNVRAVGVEATNAVYTVIGELTGEGGASEELEKMLAKMAPSVRREIQADLNKLMDEFGVLGFGPQDYTDQFKQFNQLKVKVEQLKSLLLKAVQLSKGATVDTGE